MAKKKKSKDVDWAPHTQMDLKVHRFLGVALGGGKTDRTRLALIEYFPQQKKIFLSRLFDRISSELNTSGDAELLNLIQSIGKVELIAFDAPLTLPKCFDCTCKCPGFETCTEPEILWMWKHHQKKTDKRKKLFTPYTERCVEQYLQTELEIPFHLGHALGANMAPLTARMNYLMRRIDIKKIEVFPTLSVYRIGRSIGVDKRHLLFHKHSVGGDVSRRAIIEQIIASQVSFVYEQDKRVMVENNQAFEAFICALTAVLQFQGHCEPRPKDFPKLEGWIAIPKALV